MAMKLGFIGLGIMGRPMALNLHNAGHELWVHGRRPVTMEVLVEAGAHPCKTIAEVAASADIIFIMVSDTPDVEQVIAGEHGLMSRLRKGQIVVAITDEGEATLKRWYPEKNRIRLEPANSTMKPIYVRNAKVLGVLVGVVRKV